MTITPEQIQRWREMHNGELRLFRLSNPAGKELLDELERLMKVEEAAKALTFKLHDSLDVRVPKEAFSNLADAIFKGGTA